MFKDFTDKPNAMNLQLSLLRKWFYMTSARFKPEDYRLPTPYWCSRLLLVGGKQMPQKWWKEHLGTISGETSDIWIIDNLHLGSFTFKPFTTNTVTLGYPKSTDTDRIRRYKHAGIEIREGRQEWGAEPGKIYFVIKHGEPL